MHTIKYEKWVDRMTDEILAGDHPDIWESIWDSFLDAEHGPLILRLVAKNGRDTTDVEDLQGMIAEIIERYLNDHDELYSDFLASEDEYARELHQER